MAQALQKPDLEILVATMNRDSLDFLSRMFPFADFFSFSVLVINQTTKDKQLQSPYTNVRIINSFEKGLSKSRNLALDNALGKIVLVADDDVQFVKGFDDAILSFYNANPLADIAFFKTVTFEGKPYSAYYPETVKITSQKNLVPVLSIEVAMRLSSIKNNDIRFNELFGLGAKFEDAEMLYFLRSAHNKGLTMYFCPEYIVRHQAWSSSDDVTSERLIYAKSAGYYKRFGFWSYFYVLKYIIFLLRKRLIPLKGAVPRLKTALQGIRDYKQCLRAKKDTLYG